MIADEERPGHQVRRAVLRTPAVSPAELAADRAAALALTPVSRETEGRLEQFLALLNDWQQRVNLVAPSTVPKVWTRHVADSLQLLQLAPLAQTWVDLGTGGGFPGLVIACALAETPGAQVHLVESNARKAAFLRAAIASTGAPALVHATRVVDFMQNAPDTIEIVTARALAPLADLLAAAYPLLKHGAKGLFLKGQDVGAELTDATKYWTLKASLVPSRTDPDARVVVVTSAEKKLPLRREDTPLLR
jgi:16S rRNA (guanine527-N7)-methyltransferase